MYQKLLNATSKWFATVLDTISVYNPIPNGEFYKSSDCEMSKFKQINHIQEKNGIMFFIFPTCV